MIAPDGSRLYVTDSGTGNVHVVDTATRTVLGTPIRRSRGPTTATLSSPEAVTYTRRPSGCAATVSGRDDTGAETTRVSNGSR
ncbi:hypothetical protein ACFZDB_24895 [Streptomyces luteogriseus]|uniref:hypothetical protein n=1 Tax=Streptomyces luteogriseus TaxID=68233 RepID=UPI0036EBD205